MSVSLIGAFVINCIIIALEIWSFKGLKNKIDVIKYYTFLQNALALIVSVVFCFYLLLSFAMVITVPEWVRGLRYTVTTGLCLATAVYYVVLVPGKNKKNILSDKDFKSGYSSAKANLFLHIICPLASLVSFICFERELILSSAEWTGYVAIPSVLYWCTYGILSAAHLWEEPYDFSSSHSTKSRIRDVLTFVFIPIAFVVLSIMLWSFK